MSQTAQHVVAVGGVVLHDQAVLLVRQTYGPARGRYLFPGGHVDPGETLDQAVIREVHEETGLATRVLGLVGIRTRCDGTRADTYVMFLLEPLGGTLKPDGHEHDDALLYQRRVRRPRNTNHRPLTLRRATNRRRSLLPTAIGRGLRLRCRWTRSTVLAPVLLGLVCRT